MMQQYETSTHLSVISIAQCQSQGHLQPEITTSTDIISGEYECPAWMTAEICDNNFLSDRSIALTT